MEYQEFFIGNIKGDKGDPGTSLKILGYYATLDELSSAITNPEVGDCYGVGSTYPYDIYIYSSGGWVNNGKLQGAKGDTGEKGEQGEQGAKGEKGDKGDTGEKGDDGTDGTNATITGVTATVDGTTGTPSVSVEVGGTESARSFRFLFSGLKGEKGDKGDTGEKGDDGTGAATVDINEQTPTYAESSTLVNLTSGEKISIAFGKIKKAITDLMAHLTDKTKHITVEERTFWNSLGSEKVACGSYVGTGTTGKADANQTGCNVLTFDFRPRVIIIKKRGDSTPTIIFADDKDFHSYTGKSFGGICYEVSTSNKNAFYWLVGGQWWRMKANLETGYLSDYPYIDYTDEDDEAYRAIDQLNWLGETYDYVAFGE